MRRPQAFRGRAAACRAVRARPRPGVAGPEGEGAAATGTLSRRAVRERKGRGRSARGRDGEKGRRAGAGGRAARGGRGSGRGADARPHPRVGQGLETLVPEPRLPASPLGRRSSDCAVVRRSAGGGPHASALGVRGADHGRARDHARHGRRPRRRRSRPSPRRRLGAEPDRAGARGAGGRSVGPPGGAGARADVRSARHEAAKRGRDAGEWVRADRGVGGPFGGGAPRSAGGAVGPFAAGARRPRCHPPRDGVQTEAEAAAAGRTP